MYLREIGDNRRDIRSPSEFVILVRILLRRLLLRRGSPLGENGRRIIDFNERKYTDGRK